MLLKLKLQLGAAQLIIIPNRDLPVNHDRRIHDVSITPDRTGPVINDKLSQQSVSVETPPGKLLYDWLIFVIDSNC